MTAPSSASDSALKSAAAPPTGTSLSDEDAQDILRRYNLRLRDLRRILAGTINSNYWVSTDAGPAFLRVNEGKTAADASFEAELIWHLGSRGFLTPQLWRTRASEPYVMWRRSPHAAAQPVMLMTWVDGHELTEQELGEEHAFIAGVLLGQLHLCTAGFALSRPGIYTVARIKDRLKRLQRDERARAAVGPLLTELQAEVQELGTLRRRDLPGGIGHGDLFPDNLLFARRQLGRPPESCFGHGPLGWILDLEQAAALPFIYDVAVALLSFCAPMPPAVAGSLPEKPGQAEPPGQSGQPEPPGAATLGPLHVARAQALIAGYQTMRVLGEAEWRALLSELRWAAVRFTTTRLTDVARYGQPVAPGVVPPSTPRDPPLPASHPEQAPAPPRSRSRKIGHSPTHSKDYRDFAHRLALLRGLTPDDIDKALRGPP